MPRALVDTTVLFAAAYRRDSAHDDALPILSGIDTAELPEAIILDYVLGETLNGLTTHAGHDAAVDFLDRVEENTRFHIDSLTADEFAAAKALFRQHERFSFVDAAVVAYMQAEGFGYLYAFDDDFDAAEGVYRLDIATNPY
jgi:uncharacterized protein